MPPWPGTLDYSRSIFQISLVLPHNAKNLIDNQHNGWNWSNDIVEKVLRINIETAPIFLKKWDSAIFYSYYPPTLCPKIDVFKKRFMRSIRYGRTDALMDNGDIIELGAFVVSITPQQIEQ